ncbi:hypothetical protein CLAIMM_15154 [Cladophialophora immunda]|nr:hypothetical protein CLAIMM_15154 [Cladophialophora immunda]
MVRAQVFPVTKWAKLTEELLTELTFVHNGIQLFPAKKAINGKGKERKSSKDEKRKDGGTSKGTGRKPISYWLTVLSARLTLPANDIRNPREGQAPRLFSLWRVALPLPPPPSSLRLPQAPSHKQGLWE